MLSLSKYCGHLNVLLCLFCVLFLKVFAEFTRVASKDLERDFFESLDRHIPRFLEIFKSKKGVIGRTLAELLTQAEMKVSNFKNE